MFSEWRKTLSCGFAYSLLRALSSWLWHCYSSIWLAGNLWWDSLSYVFLFRISFVSPMLVPHCACAQQHCQTDASLWWTKSFLGFVPSKHVRGRTNIEQKFNTREGRGNQMWYLMSIQYNCIHCSCKINFSHNSSSLYCRLASLISYLIVHFPLVEHDRACCLFKE